MKGRKGQRRRKEKHATWMKERQREKWETSKIRKYMKKKGIYRNVNQEMTINNFRKKVQNKVDILK